MRFGEALVCLESSQQNSVWNFSLVFIGTTKWDCIIKIEEMFSFLPLINDSVIIGLSFCW